MNSGDLRHQAGKETRGQKVLEHQVQLYSWEKTREFRMTWALESDEKIGVGRKAVCRIQARGQRQSRNPRERKQVGFQKAGGKEGELRGICTKGGNKTLGPRDSQEPKGAGTKLGVWGEEGRGWLRNSEGSGS